MFKHGSLVLATGTAEVTQESTAHHNHLSSCILQYKVTNTFSSGTHQLLRHESFEAICHHFKLNVLSKQTI